MEGLEALATARTFAPLGTVRDVPVSASGINQILFCSEVVTDWHVASPICYRGVWQGKSYEDNDLVQDWHPPRLLVVTHWSPLSGTADAPRTTTPFCFD